MSGACPNCGSEANPAGARFCRSCGASLEAAPERRPPQQNEPQAAPDETEPAQDEPAGPTAQPDAQAGPAQAGAPEVAIAGFGRARTAGPGRTVKLKEMTATLDRWEATDVISGKLSTPRAEGVFVIAVVTLGNRLNSPVEVDPERTFQLLVDGRRFEPDIPAMGSADDDHSWLDIGWDGIQPRASATGTVVFDIPKASARKLEDEGMVLVKQFSDAEYIGEKPALPVAGLKLSG